jgi:oligopeptide/dipeptide ABC transporter ATP-binding protein
MKRVQELLASVGLPDAQLDSRPAAYSGGGRQRIAIARALALDPELLICDEPTASLDVSVQAQILNLLQELRAAHALSMLVVSHDLDIIRRMCDDMVVMYAGRVMESGDAAALRAQPAHPYTAALLASVPTTDPTTRAAPGAPPPSSAGAPARRDGCVFAGRCPKVQPVCRHGMPPEVVTVSGRASCRFPLAEPKHVEIGVRYG